MKKIIKKSVLILAPETLRHLVRGGGASQMIPTDTGAMCFDSCRACFIADSGAEKCPKL